VNDAELVLDSPSSEEDITVEEGVVGINQIEGLRLGTRGAGTGALACIALGRDEWGRRDDLIFLLMRRRMAC
jgi:hypothetical protein